MVQYPNKLKVQTTPKKQDISKYFQMTPKQKEAFKFIGKGVYMFFGGARGGGKTHFARLVAMLVCMQIPGIRVLIIRKTSSELEENFIEVMLGDYPQEVFKYKHKKAGTQAFKFQNGSTIIFRSLEYEANLKKIQGIEYQLIIVDEANNYYFEWLERIRGSLRGSKTRIENFIPTMLMTGNPGGSADRYFKSRYVNPDYEKWSAAELLHKDKYVFISAKVEDNEYVGQEYIDNLEGQTDKNLVAAWRHGDWNIFEGQFFDMWNEAAHIVDDFPIPDTWIIKAGLDMGHSSKHPTVVLWFAEDPITNNIYCIREYIASGVVEDHAIYMKFIHNMIDPEGNIPVYCDPSIFNDKDVKKTHSDSPTTRLFFDHGVTVLRANNPRVEGWRILKQFLSYVPNVTTPRLRFFRSCKETILNMPLFRYNTKSDLNKEDLDTKQRYDDIADALRYGICSGFMYSANEDIQVDPALVAQMLNKIDDETINKSFVKAQVQNTFKNGQYNDTEINAWDIMYAYAVQANTPIRSRQRV